MYPKETVIFALALATLLINLSSLLIWLHVLDNDVHLKRADSIDSVASLELPWNNSEQVALEFNNVGGFHITNDDDWEPYSQPKMFKLDGRKDRNYMISMQHQLYCLNYVRIAYLSYHTERPKQAEDFYEDAEKCIEQLRQYLMCHSDLTLEPTTLHTLPDGTKTPGTKGIGVVHRCNAWDRLESTIATLT